MPCQNYIYFLHTLVCYGMKKHEHNNEQLHATAWLGIGVRAIDSKLTVPFLFVTVTVHCDGCGRANKTWCAYVRMGVLMCSRRHDQTGSCCILLNQVNMDVIGLMHLITLKNEFRIEIWKEDIR